MFVRRMFDVPSLLVNNKSSHSLSIVPNIIRKPFFFERDYVAYCTDRIRWIRGRKSLLFLFTSVDVHCFCVMLSSSFEVKDQTLIKANLESLTHTFSDSLF